MKFDPGYTFVEAGEEFGRQHAEAYADANIARTSFGNAQPALDYLLRVGGSAYLPERLAAPHIRQGRLYELKLAPTFRRRAYVVIDKQAYASWPWMKMLLPSLIHRERR